MFLLNRQYRSPWCTWSPHLSASSYSIHPPRQPADSAKTSAFPQHTLETETATHSPPRYSDKTPSSRASPSTQTPPSPAHTYYSPQTPPPNQPRTSSPAYG